MKLYGIKYEYKIKYLKAKARPDTVRHLPTNTKEKLRLNTIHLLAVWPATSQFKLIMHFYMTKWI